MTATIPIARAASPPKEAASLMAPLPVSVAAEAPVELLDATPSTFVAEVMTDVSEAAVYVVPSMTVVVPW